MNLVEEPSFDLFSPQSMDKDGEWIKVSRKRKGYKKQDQDVGGKFFATKNRGTTNLTDFDKVMKHKAESFFFTNFPKSWDSEEDGYLRNRLEKCWVGKAKNFHVLQNAWDIVKNNGLVDCNVKYVGGLSLLFEWESKLYNQFYQRYKSNYELTLETDERDVAVFGASAIPVPLFFRYQSSLWTFVVIRDRLIQAVRQQTLQHARSDIQLQMAFGYPVTWLHNGLLEKKDHIKSQMMHTGSSQLLIDDHFEKEISLLPPPSRKCKGIQTRMPNLPSTCEVPDSSAIDTEMTNASDPNDSEKDVAPDENLDGASADADMGNTPVVTHELRPLLRMLAGTSASEFDILKILDERKE
ncbi:ATPase, AAA-type, core [Artemisia annua]|uniref:ATPase, AAA-type, core n=1 Tax=Artemisia annua TaxID=35608 RepID=A0A2U1KZD7_ARTAN|nr:ATPase, AAA-type, core [Artemisia annua]